MGYAVCWGKNGINSFSGSNYLNPDKGTKRLCIRTGTKPNDIIKYGLTTNSSASEYCGMRMKIDGNTAYIGRSEATTKTYTSKSSKSSSSIRSYTFTSSFIKNRTVSSIRTIISGRVTQSSTRSYTGIEDNNGTHMKASITESSYIKFDEINKNHDIWSYKTEKHLNSSTWLSTYYTTKMICYESNNAYNINM